ncbi:DUF4430 domain-containing protein [Chloroflexota bacterium]
MPGKMGRLILAVIFSTILCGCSVNNPSPDIDKNPAAADSATAEAIVAVTRDFGNELLLQQTVVIEPDTTAMAALQMVATVETKYGGGFISAINGLSSEYEGANKSKNDWLFHINGIACGTGAGAYILQDRDIEQWDYRGWSYIQYIPAIIGNYPQPFLSGYQGKLKPTAVVYEEQFKNVAQSLADGLKNQGISEVSAIAFEQLSPSSREQSNLILVGRPDNELIAEINSAHKKLGLFAYFQQSKLIVLNAEGEVISEAEAASGLIEATQNPWHPKGIGAGESAVWIISGTDDDGVRSAAEVIINNYDDFRFAYAVAVINGEIIRIPE